MSKSCIKTHLFSARVPLLVEIKDISGQLAPCASVYYERFLHFSSDVLKPFVHERARLLYLLGRQQRTHQLVQLCIVFQNRQFLKEYFREELEKKKETKTAETHADRERVRRQEKSCESCKRRRGRFKREEEGVVRGRLEESGERSRCERERPFRERKERSIQERGQQKEKGKGRHFKRETTGKNLERRTERALREIQERLGKTVEKRHTQSRRTRDFNEEERFTTVNDALLLCCVPF